MPVYKNKDNGTWYVMTQYEPIPAPKTQPQERGKRSKNKDYER